MATAEQNALLGMQLFSPVGEQVAAQNAAKTGLLLKLLTMNREEQLRRDLATQGYDKSIELAGLQATREDARWKAQDEREGSRLTAMQPREDPRAGAAPTKQLRNSIASTYPKYAAEATRLGEKVRPIAEFAETWEGLGDLQAEMARLEQTRVRRDQDAASTAAVGELDDAASAVAESKKGLEALMRASPEDEKFAKSRAVDAVRQSIEMGGVSGAPKKNSKAAKSGLAALARGDVAEATSLLGSEVLAQYDSAFQTAMQAAPNFKSRMQQLTIAQQNFQSAQRNLQAIQSDLRKAAAGNNTLATKLTTRRSSLQELMGPAPAPAKPRTFEEFTPPPPAPGGSGAPAPTTGGGAPAAPGGPGVIGRAGSALADIGRSEVEQRVPWLAPTAGALGTAARATGSAIASPFGRAANAVMNPIDTLLAILEAQAAQRRAAQQEPDELVIGSGSN